MKRRFEAEGSSQVPHEKVSSIRAEYPPAETSVDLSNYLGERLMKLPFELKQRIIYSLTPEERLPLRLVSKAMLDFVDASMSDMQVIRIDFHFIKNSSVYMETINPYNGAMGMHWYHPVPSSLPFLLKWTGAQLKTLEFNIPKCVSGKKDIYLSALDGVFEALNSENLCPKLKNFKLWMKEVMWDNSEVILSNILEYITKRQLQTKATDRPTPFLQSLSLWSFEISKTLKTTPVKPLDSEKRHKFLQDLLDQCHGLKELYVDSLLKYKDLPIVALRYPTTLTLLGTCR